MSDEIKISMRVPGTSPMPELLDMIKKVEDAGFDGAGILDSQMICRDTFVTMGLAASATSRLQLFPAVTNPFGRIPSVLAGAAQTVAEIAPGRTKFMIGTGYTSASTIGRRPATLRQMRRCIMEVKALLAGESVDYNGMSNRLDFAGSDGEAGVPVLMAASGPRSLELAGEVADGALVLVGYTPGIMGKALEHLEAGAQRSGRTLDDLDVVFAVRTCVADSNDEARRLARPVSVHWGLLWGGPNWLPYSDIELPDYEIPQAVRDVYPDLGARAELGGSDRAHAVRQRRRQHATVRRDGVGWDAGTLHRAHPRDVKARGEPDLPDAVPDLRAARSRGPSVRRAHHSSAGGGINITR